MLIEPTLADGVCDAASTWGIRMLLERITHCQYGAEHPLWARVFCDEGMMLAQNVRKLTRNYVFRYVKPQYIVVLALIRRYIYGRHHIFLINHKHP